MRSGQERRGARKSHDDSYLLSTLAILPLLIPEYGLTTLLSGDTMGLLERLAEGPRGDLGVAVVSIEKANQFIRIFQ